MSFHLTMTPTPWNSKKVKVSVYKLGGKRHRANSGSGSMVVLKPKKTRRGKTIYTEVDAGPYYTSSDEGGKSPKRKPSKTVRHTRAVALECAFLTNSNMPDAIGQRMHTLTTQGKVAVSSCPFLALSALPCLSTFPLKIIVAFLFKPTPAIAAATSLRRSPNLLTDTLPARLPYPSGLMASWIIV